MTGTGATKHSPSPAHTDDAVLLLDIRAQRWGALPQADLTPWNGDPELKVLCSAGAAVQVSGCLLHTTA